MDGTSIRALKAAAGARGKNPAHARGGAPAVADPARIDLDSALVPAVALLALLVDAHVVGVGELLALTQRDAHSRAVVQIEVDGTLYVRSSREIIERSRSCASTKRADNSFSRA